MSNNAENAINVVGSALDGVFEVAGHWAAAAPQGRGAALFTKVLGATHSAGLGVLGKQVSGDSWGKATAQFAASGVAASYVAGWTVAGFGAAPEASLGFELFGTLVRTMRPE